MPLQFLDKLGVLPGRLDGMDFAKLYKLIPLQGMKSGGVEQYLSGRGHSYVRYKMITRDIEGTEMILGGETIGPSASRLNLQHTRDHMARHDRRSEDREPPGEKGFLKHPEDITISGK